jgi:YYY domain-containing protein
MAAVETQILTVILWLIILKFSQITVYPYLKPALGSISYVLAYPVSILLLTIVSWYLGLAGLPVQIVLILFAVLGGFAFYKKQYELTDLKSMVRWDMIFLAAFALLLIVRWFSPGIIPSGEKFMDAAFLGSIMLDPTVTPLDPWFAGETLNIYYYLGHWMMGVLGILAMGSNTVVFNLMLPTVFALAAVSAYAIGVLLLKRHQWIPMLVLIIPNAALLWHAFTGKGPIDAWWASTRVIGDGATINEYPLFSFLWGDPHAHLLACFNQLVFICLLAVMITRWQYLKGWGKYLLICLLSLSLGTMPAMNSWDVIIYAGVYVIVAFMVWWRFDHHQIRKLLPFLLVPVLSLLSYAPFLYLMLTTGGSSIEGFFLVTTPSPIIEFLGVYLFFLVVFVIYGFPVLKKYPWLIALPIIFGIFGYASLGVALFCIILLLGKKEWLPETIFGVIGLAILVFLEIFYLKDYMGDSYYRMNTVFKFGFCAWFFLGISSMLIIGKWLKNRGSPVNSTKKWKAWAAACVVFVCLAGIFVVGGINLGYPGGNLDGDAWVAVSHPADYQGIEYLQSLNEPSIIVVEAEGTSYTYGSRVSTMTGLSTIIGWTGHEVGWRTGIDETEDVSTRMADVRAIYEDPTQTISLMEKYGATHLFVGEVEQEMYTINLPLEDLVNVFSSDGVDVYQIR